MQLGRLTTLTEDLQLGIGEDVHTETAKRLRDAGAWIAEGTLEEDVRRAVEDLQKRITAA